MVMTHHTTFFINSLAHIWGSQPFTDRNSARDNGILAFFTFGEGYHNFHHLFENDYRNGIRWWQFDPTKWLIQSAAWCGLAKDPILPGGAHRAGQAGDAAQRPRPGCTSRMTGELWQALLQEEYDKLSQQIQHYYASRKTAGAARAQGPGALRQVSGCSWNIARCGTASSLPSATGAASWPASPETLRIQDQEDRQLAVFLHNAQGGRQKNGATLACHPLANSMFHVGSGNEGRRCASRVSAPDPRCLPEQSDRPSSLVAFAHTADPPPCLSLQPEYYPVE